MHEKKLARWKKIKLILFKNCWSFKNIKKINKQRKISA